MPMSQTARIALADVVTAGIERASEAKRLTRPFGGVSRSPLERKGKDGSAADEVARRLSEAENRLKMSAEQLAD